MIAVQNGRFAVTKARKNAGGGLGCRIAAIREREKQNSVNSLSKESK